MYKIKFVFASFLIFALAGCAGLTDGNRVSPPSRDMGNIAPLRTPPGLSVPYDTLYPIPQKSYASKVSAVDITPPTLDSNQNSGKGWFSWY